MKSKAKYFEKEKVCKNCGSTQIDNYCSNCGQKIYTKRFTLKNFFFVFLDAFSIEKGFLLTFKMLFFKPGVLINEYIKGKTKSYFNPLKYVILVAGIYAIIVVSSGILDSSMEVGQEVMFKNSEVLKQQQEAVDNNEEALQLQNKLIEKFKQYVNLIPLLMIPFTGLVTMWFYRSRKLFYGEFLIVNCYIFSQSFIIIALILVPIVLIFPFLKSYFPAISAITTLAYISFALYKTFKGSPILAVIKTIFIYIIGSLFFFIFLLIALYLFINVISLFGINLADLL
jgi:uncharacterized protein DUF3667